MSIAHPRQRQIKLPFNVPKPGLTKAKTRICGICRQKDSSYTCPRCNVPYCSLSCFQNESHAQCSEPFYKSTVMEEIATDPQADFEEKRRMLEMLRKFEDAQLEGEDALKQLQEEEHEEDEGDELETALQGVDIDDLDSNKLFHLLPQHHRDAFLAALRDPESELTKNLLESAAGDGISTDELPSALPWWEADRLSDDPEDSETEMVYATLPTMVNEDLLSDLSPPEGVGEKLIYNAIAISCLYGIPADRFVSLAYFHVLLSFRLPSLSEAYLLEQALTPEDAKQEFISLVPFLHDPKSTVRYTSARDAWTSVWEAIGVTFDHPPQSQLLIRLLSLLEYLLHPSLVTTEVPRLMILLSDAYSLFSKPKPKGAAPRKLLFYLAALKQLDRADWLDLEGEIRKEIEKLRNELEDGTEETDDADVDRPALKI